MAESSTEDANVVLISRYMELENYSSYIISENIFGKLVKSWAKS